MRGGSSRGPCEPLRVVAHLLAWEARFGALERRTLLQAVVVTQRLLKKVIKLCAADLLGWKLSPHPFDYFC